MSCLSVSILLGKAGFSDQAPALPREGGPGQPLASWSCPAGLELGLPRVCDIQAGRQGQEIDVPHLICPRYLLLAGARGRQAAKTFAGLR